MNSRVISSRALLVPTNQKLPPPIYTVSELGNSAAFGDKKNPICLTFDDGPDPAYTDKILSILADFDIKATFFVLGRAVEKFPKLLEQIAIGGHAIGNHSYSHQHPWMISSECAKNEVSSTTAMIRQITGAAPRWFRPPFGRLRPAMRRQAYSEKMATVLWSHSIIDWGPLGTEEGIANRLLHIKPNDIVLMHDGKREHNHPDIIIQCLPGLLRSLKESYFVACTLDGVS